MSRDPLRHHRDHSHLHGAFGGGGFGQAAERFARFFGTAKFILGQTCIIIVWLTINAVGIIARWDPYPFILLNLVFSTQAAYAAPLILLAQTRQADRDKMQAEADAKHREELAGFQTKMLKENTELTQEVHGNTTHIEELLRRTDALCQTLGVQATAPSAPLASSKAKAGARSRSPESSPRRRAPRK